jgi:thioredoxin-related protein
MAQPSPTARQHKVLVFTTPTCSWCQRAKTYLLSLIHI